MKKLLMVSAITAAFTAPTAVMAQTAPAAEPQSPHTFTANVGLFSDYRFRGISQTFGEPAIQGGFDYSHASGFYAGIWSSNVYGNQLGIGNPVYAGGSQEVDLYAGYKLEVVKDVTLDVGFLQYVYPNAKWLVPTKEKYDNQELYVAASWKWLTAKYSYGITDFFGLNQNTNGASFCGVSKDAPGILYTATNAPNGCQLANGGSHGSGYLDLTGTWEIADKTNLIAHFGYQSVKNYGLFSYVDYKLGVTKEWAGVVWGAAYIATDAKKPFYTVIEVDGSGSLKERKTGEGTLVLSVSKTF